MITPKVFCIGFHKTGTSSMHVALQYLGYTVTSMCGANNPIVTTHTPMRQWIYGKGCVLGNESIYVKRFEQHNEEVQVSFPHANKRKSVIIRCA